MDTSDPTPDLAPSITPAPNPPSQIYGSALARFLAFLLDYVLLFFLSLPLVLLTSGAPSPDAMPEKRMFFFVLQQCVAFVVVWFYFAGYESSAFQGTPGKMITGLRVTDLHGNRISFVQATGRFVAKILSGSACLVGYIQIPFMSKRQGMHDLLARTYVLAGRANADPSQGTAHSLNTGTGRSQSSGRRRLDDDYLDESDYLPPR
jgi:uncharacterized RDD family membrane protein YckC